MGRYVTPSPSAAQAGRIKKQQVFKTSGTFTPSQALLDAGGVVEVRCVGGGGSGYRGSNTGGGSSGMDITRIVTVTAPVTVTIGAGGYASFQDYGSDGGTTSFGGVVVALGGKKGEMYAGGVSSGEGSMPGFPPQLINQSGSNSPVSVAPGRGGGSGGSGESNQNAPPNSGGGGGGGASYFSGGGSGLCIVTWEE